jgi:hypothetical protein
LRPGKIGARTIHRVTEPTAQGLENIKNVFSTRSSGADTLEAVVSIGDVAPGDTRGSGNAWFGVRGAFTRTLAYWRRVMTDAFDLIAQMTEAIEGLYRSLCASDARNVDLEAQNTTLVEQLKARTAECEGHAQRCRVAERTAKRAGLEATRRLAELGEEHTKQGGALWMRYAKPGARCKRSGRPINRRVRRPPFGV